MCSSDLVFRSLNFYNARLYFASLLLSTIGSWLQLTATSYLVYRLTGKASDLGYNVAFQFLPMLFLGTWAGSFADRFDRRTIMLCTQILLAVQALLLGVLAVLITPREEEPQIDVTMANVIVPFEGASAREVEQLVASPLEQKLGEIEGVKHVYTVSRPGVAVATVEYDVGVARQPALVQIGRAHV